MILLIYCKCIKQGTSTTDSLVIDSRFLSLVPCVSVLGDERPITRLGVSVSKT